ncbi:E3 ubiquitin-protein ligase sina, partial [Taenia solium]
QSSAASVDLFDFDCAGADVDSKKSGCSGGGVGNGVGAVDEVNHPASGSLSPITADLAPTNNKDLIILFACLVHMGFALSPILQCQSGHIVFVSCRIKLSSCPICRRTLDIHNLAMEKLAASILFACKYALTGCTETFPYAVKAEHESVCEHRLRCAWECGLGDDAVMLWALLHAVAGEAETSVFRPGFLRSCPPYRNQITGRPVYVQVRSFLICTPLLPS